MQNVSLPDPDTKSLFKIALPLIISGLASNMAIFADRMILSWYNTEMMTHVTTSSNFSWLFLFTISSMAYVSKIYVGQYNGAQKYKEAGHITWQLIIFSVISMLIFALAYLFSPWIVPSVVHTYGLNYFKILMLGGITWPLSAAISGFLIGTYQTTIVLIIFLVANAVNIILDLYWIPEFGTSGAAWATIAAMSLQTLCFFWMFLSPYNQKKYHTHRIRLDVSLLLRALRLGYPESVAHFFEMAAWAFIISIMALKGPEFLLISSLSQNLFILFMFTYCELGNAVKTLAANYVGGNRLDCIPKLLSSALKIHLIFVCVLLGITTINPDWLIEIFNLSNHSVSIQNNIMTALTGLTVFFLLDGIAYILINVLAAFGDTFVSMIISSTNMWAFIVAPTFIAANFMTSMTPVTLPVVILPFYGIMVCSLLYLRYKSAPVTFLTDQC